MGEILLSLSYLPTAERLTVVVVKAKNLIWTNDKATAGESLCTQLLHEAGRGGEGRAVVLCTGPRHRARAPVASAKLRSQA